MSLRNSINSQLDWDSELLGISNGWRKKKGYFVKIGNFIFGSVYLHFLLLSLPLREIE